MDRLANTIRVLLIMKAAALVSMMIAAFLVGALSVLTNH